MSCALIFPPGVDPRGPHLALPSLAASLRRAGETVHLIDANIEAVRSLLQPQRVRRAGAILAARDGSDPATTSGRLALSADTLAGHLEPALAVFDDPVAFFDAAALGAARETLVAALDLLSLAHHADLRFNIHPARYDLAACDPRCLDDLVAATGREELNLFAGDWKTSLLPRLRELRPELVGISITNRQQMTAPRWTPSRVTDTPL